MWIKLPFVVALFFHYIGRLATTNHSCDFRIDSVAYLHKDRYFMSSGDKYWLSEGDNLTLTETGLISDVCPGFQRVDVAFWWGTAADATYCDDKYLKYMEGDMSVMLMEKRDSRCSWCYLKDGRKEDSWKWNSDTLLNMLTKEIEKIDKGCDKLEAIGYGVGTLNRDFNYIYVLIVIDGSATRWPCHQIKIYQVVVNSWAIPGSRKVIEKVYTGLPKGKRLVSRYPSQQSNELYHNLIYDDGSHFLCKGSSQFPLKCDYQGTFLDLCQLVPTTTEPPTTSTTTTITTTPTTFSSTIFEATTEDTSTPNDTLTSQPPKKKSNFIRVIIIIGIVVAVIVVIALVLAFLSMHGDKVLRRDDTASEYSAVQPLLKKKKKIVKIVKKPK